MRYREEFREQPRIYIPAQYTETKLGPGIWVRSGACIRNRPKSAELRHSFSLSIIEYSRNRRLFENIGVDEYADFTRLKKDLDEEKLWVGKAKWTVSTLDYLTKLFNEFNGVYNVRYMEPEDLYDLRERYMFPVSVGSMDRGFEFLYSAGGHESWYIADRDHLHSAFRGRVPLLDFSVSQVESCLPLLKALGCNPRRLSTEVTARAVKTTPENREYASRLRRKARYIDRYVACITCWFIFT